MKSDIGRLGFDENVLLKRIEGHMMEVRRKDAKAETERLACDSFLQVPR